jgi:hypothetical protein
MGADLVASVTAGAAPETGDLCGYAVTRAGRDYPRGARQARGGGPGARPPGRAARAGPLVPDFV